MTDPQRRDWQKIVAAIKADHLSKTGIELTNWKLGQSVGMNDDGIARLVEKPGAQPRHYEGERLLALHATINSGFPSRRHCGMETNVLP